MSVEEEGRRGWVRVEPRKADRLGCSAPKSCVLWASCLSFLSVLTINASIALLLSSLLPHRTRYSPVIISTAPITLQYTCNHCLEEMLMMHTIYYFILSVMEIRRVLITYHVSNQH